MQNLHVFIFFLCIIIFSGLGISFYKEGLNCPPGQVDTNGVCKKDRDTNTFIVIIILIIIVVWLVMIKQNA